MLAWRPGRPDGCQAAGGRRYNPGHDCIKASVSLNSAARNAPAGSQPVKAELWKRVYSRVGSYWKGLVLAVLLMAGAAATQPTLAVIMKPLLDDGFSGAKPHYVWFLPLAVVGLILLRGICNFFSDYLLAWVANNVLRGIRGEMFERLLGLPDADFKRGDTGRLLNRFTIDAGNVTGYATDVITVLVRETLVVIALIGVLLYMSWALTLIILVMLPVSVGIARAFTRRLRRINRETVNMNAELTRVVSEGIDGQRVIKLFDGYDAERRRFDFVNSRLRRFAMRSATADAALTPLTQVCISVAVGAVIAVALSQANSGALTVGSFASFMAALAQIFDPIKRLTNLAGKMQKMLVAAESVFTLVDQTPEADAGTRALPEPVRGKVEFRAVSHRFPDADRDTVSAVSFLVEPGQTVALVGRSGSGKTTLVNMLPRFVLPDGGDILFDDVPIQDLTLRSLRSHLSLVSQDVVLFDDTIAANVGYGAGGTVDDARVRDALAAANLLEFVDGLPLGIHTPVGQNAARLSGGQRQRLAIARALIKNAPVLILDEATSALDNESERQVQASLERLMRGRTTLVIAHRLSTVQNADRIIVLDAGKIVEHGPHSELLAANGLYASLYNMQFRED
ncbi:lipid A export permease/ATP-binding protein MsbA [Bordetella pertussis]|uniref:ATP-dependent lipid A-core flippase n=1 Tax=Bordetella pertussis (strain Tohama I / ATCC BAA-589 / NCTC 13251) TaxID=257313 RepID=MSBA_BORPE|nr:lipid A export permease/ATP-binding protein MsbA [Bordetella pertussis]Q7VWD8.1 RecName: Full=ATP-dependent lipid A-core flippase; AltName: Full=Lipid A export ATP-binding/permease protein MsbA [Bordetella pertussis Tohama I]AEE67571.1 putative ABC transporter [Bordetella pertussis CS]AIW92566.1 ABC transporter [Bordetella pertussis B1917]AIW96073.1 ABC transporter [Bordetella pertussis B1920]AJB26927.1 ABC transporter [Bordetella pertussis 137]ALH49015.1 ABC transporter [Bordetella pertus